MSYPGTPQPHMLGGAVITSNGMQPVYANMMARRQLVLHANHQRSIKVLSGFQISIGLACISVQAFLITLDRTSSYYFDYIATGIWCGVIFIFSGIMSIIAAERNRTGMIVGAMVMNIISTVAMWAIVVFSAASVSNSVDLEECAYQCAQGRRSCRSCPYTNYYGLIGLDSSMLLLAVAEFIVSLWSAILCCKGACLGCDTCCNGTTYPEQPVYYAAGHVYGHQIMNMPQAAYNGGPQVGMVNIRQNQTGGQTVAFPRQGVNTDVAPSQAQSFSDAR